MKTFSAKNTQITKNFTRQEFDCKDGTIVPERYLNNLTELAQNLQVLRDHINQPIFISGSGYRTPTHNARVKGASSSQHLTASAADIRANNYTPAQLAQVIDQLIREGKMKQGGLGVYKNFVHYDIRGTKARW